MKALVIKSTGSWYDVEAEDGNLYRCRIKGKFRVDNIKSTNPIVVGDYVNIVSDSQNWMINELFESCLLYTSPSPRDGLLSRMPSSA